MENEFWWAGILAAVLIIALFIALRTVIKRFGIKKTCCGGKRTEKREEKILESAPMWEITVGIDDLCCENCAIRVENAFNRMEGVSAKASHEEKRAVLLLRKELSETELRAVVADCGFTAKDLQIKKL